MEIIIQFFECDINVVLKIIIVGFVLAIIWTILFFIGCVIHDYRYTKNLRILDKSAEDLMKNK